MKNPSPIISAALRTFGALIACCALAINASTITVTSNADHGLGTLRDVVAAAASGDTIHFAVSGTITLTNGPVIIDKELAISGPGAGLLTVMGTIDSTNGIDGVTNGTAFSSTCICVVTISGLTISGETYGNGGAVCNYGGLSLFDCVVSNCSFINSYGSGSGVYNSGGMLLERCVIQDNSGGFGSSASLFNSGNMTLLECTVAGNHSIGTAGGIENEGFMTLGDCTITNNSSGPVGYKGAGIANGTANTNGTIVMTNCTIMANTCGGTPEMDGGGLFNMGTAILLDCTVSDMRLGKRWWIQSSPPPQ